MNNSEKITVLSEYIGSHEVLLRQLPGPFTIKDLENRFAFASDAAAALAGYPSGEKMRGLNCYDLKNPMVEYADKLTDNNLSLMQQTKLKRFLYLRKDNTNNTSVVLMSKKPIFDDANRVIGLYSAIEQLGLVCSMLKNFANDHLSKAQPFIEVSNQYGQLNLSKREVECFFYLLRGRSNSDIATRLNLSKRTIDSYVENIKNKLSCNSRTEIFDYAYQNGFILLLPEMFINGKNAR